MQGGNTTLPAGARSGFEFRTVASGLDADPLREDFPTPHPPTRHARFSNTERRRRPVSSPTPLNPRRQPFSDIAVARGSLSLHHGIPGRWLTGAGATPAGFTRGRTRSSAGEHRVEDAERLGSNPGESTCIARRTPLAPVRDAAIVPRSNRVPACVRSRWGRVTSPTPQDMSLYGKQPQDSDGSTAPEALKSYPAGPNHDDLLLCGPANDTEWIMSSIFVGLKEAR